MQFSEFSSYTGNSPVDVTKRRQNTVGVLTRVKCIRDSRPGDNHLEMLMHAWNVKIRLF